MESESNEADENGMEVNGLGDMDSKNDHDAYDEAGANLAVEVEDVGADGKKQAEDDIVVEQPSKKAKSNPWVGLDDDEDEDFAYVINEEPVKDNAKENPKAAGDNEDDGDAEGDGTQAEGQGVIGDEGANIAAREQGLQFETEDDPGEGEKDAEEDKSQPMFRFSHGAAALKKTEEQIKAQKETGVTALNYASFSHLLARRHTPFEIDLDKLEEKQWRRQGATLDDFFNFGFNEATWREYAAKQVALRVKHMKDTGRIEELERQHQIHLENKAAYEVTNNVQSQTQSIQSHVQVPDQQHLPPPY